MEQFIDLHENLLSVIEAARILRISKTKAYKMIHNNELPHVQMGGRIVVPEKAIYSWIRRRTIGG